VQDFEWRQEFIDYALKAEQSGQSYAEITKDINEKLKPSDMAGISRNAVIGKVRRYRAMNPQVGMKHRQRVRAHVEADTKRRMVEAEERLIAKENKPVRVRVRPSVPQIAPPVAETEPDPVPRGHLRGFTHPQTILSRTSKQCCYPHPLDSPSAEMRVCGDEVEGRERPYCVYHAKLVYQPVVSRRISPAY
jgi:hypothetical protein